MLPPKLAMNRNEHVDEQLGLIRVPHLQADLVDGDGTAGDRERATACATHGGIEWRPVRGIIGLERAASERASKDPHAAWYRRAVAEAQTQVLAERQEVRRGRGECGHQRMHGLLRAAAA